MDYLQYIRRKGYRIRAARLPKSTLGLTSFTQKAVFIDPAQNIVHTLLHEYAHIKYPKVRSEEKIDRLATELMLRLTRKEIQRIAIEALRHTEKIKGEV